MKDSERLSAHTRILPPLTVGDCVRIQNQTGPSPTKWDKTGIVIEVRQFDQYVIRVDGSGRVTLRNRKFLRLYHPVLARAPIATLPTPTTTATQYQPLSPMTPKVTPTSFNQQTTPNSEATQPEMPMSPNNTLVNKALAPPEQIETPSNQTDDTPDTPPPKTRMPRALRALQSHNKPGLKETEPLPESRSRFK